MTGLSIFCFSEKAFCGLQGLSLSPVVKQSCSAPHMPFQWNLCQWKEPLHLIHSIRTVMETVQCWNRRAENPAGHYSFARQFFVTLWEPSYWPPAPFPRIYSFIEMNLALLIFSNRRVAVLRKKSAVTCSLNTVVHDSKYILIFL